jgi:hypothetical protein
MQLGETRRVGNYAVDVLRPRDSEALSAWLIAHGLRALPDNAKPIVQRYITRGWCFMSSRLTNEAGGTATPHPLMVTFPVRQAIFPMELTATANSKARVELFVAGTDEATASGFDVEAADRFTQKQEQMWYMPLNEPVSHFFQGENLLLTLGSPDAIATLWDHCVVTRLGATLGPADMGHDVVLSWRPLSPSLRNVFSPRGRLELCQTLLLGGATIVLLTVMVACQGRRRPSRPAARTIAALSGGVLLGVTATFFGLTVVPVRTGIGTLHSLHNANTFGSVAGLCAATGLIYANATPAQIVDLPRQAVEHDYCTREISLNPITGEERRYEQSPGNLMVKQIQGQPYLCTYDMNGIEIPLTILPRPRASAPATQR